MALDERGALAEWAIAGEVAAFLHGAGAGGSARRCPPTSREQLRLPAGDDPRLFLELRPAAATQTRG